MYYLQTMFLGIKQVTINNIHIIGNFLDVDGIKTLCEMLKKNTTIRTLGISG